MPNVDSDCYLKTSTKTGYDGSKFLSVIPINYVYLLNKDTNIIEMVKGIAFDKDLKNKKTLSAYDSMYNPSIITPPEIKRLFLESVLKFESILKNRGFGGKRKTAMKNRKRNRRTRKIRSRR